MKYLLTILLSVVLISFASCSDDGGSNPESPDLQYVGNWVGETSTDSVAIQVSNVDNNAVITKYALRVRTSMWGGTVTQRTTASRTQGFTTVSNGAFVLNDGNTTFEGQFTAANTMTLQYVYGDVTGSMTVTK